MYLHVGKSESMIKKYEATNTFATIDSSKKDGFTFGTTLDEYK